MPPPHIAEEEPPGLAMNLSRAQRLRYLHRAAHQAALTSASAKATASVTPSNERPLTIDASHNNSRSSLRAEVHIVFSSR
jgi:hypothetical protein